MRRLLDRTRRRPKVTPLPKHHRTRAPEDGSSAGRRALRQTQVLVHATRYVAKRASYEGPLLVSHTFHEETVVRHEDERARPAVEQVLHESEHVGIEVVARLVQNQDIWFLQNGQQQRQTALLTTRKILDTTPHLLLRKSEALEQLLGARLLALDHHVTLAAGKHLANGVVLDGLQLVELLGQHAKPDRGTNLHASAERLEFALDDIEQGGLTGAVLAEQAVAVARTNKPGHIGKNGTTQSHGVRRHAAGSEAVRRSGIAHSRRIVRHGGAPRELVPSLEPRTAAKELA